MDVYCKNSHGPHYVFGTRYIIPTWCTGYRIYIPHMVYWVQDIYTPHGVLGTGYIYTPHGVLGTGYINST